MFPGREEPASPIVPEKRRTFATTHWSVVLATRDAEPNRAHQALECLCATYWYPVYACIRRSGKDHAEAEDIAQGFFERLLSNRTFQHLEPARTRLRAYLWVALRRYLQEINMQAHRHKRSGSAPHLSWDDMSARERYRCEAVDRWTPEQLFDRRWALALLDRALQRLKTETAVARHPELFEQLKSGILGEKDGHSHAELAQLLGMSLGSLRVTVLRLRRRFGQLCREEVAHTVDDPEAVEEELRYLMRVIARSTPEVGEVRP
ncbi:MAG: sigma-70 family RNA polymerase sigma factor [Verrucomicrobia bacterium]|nr:sigma-70 family RNA polymerase sigma factor [Verrucomicrobiota bacterium]